KARALLSLPVLSLKIKIFSYRHLQWGLLFRADLFFHNPYFSQQPFFVDITLPGLTQGPCLARAPMLRDPAQTQAQIRLFRYDSFYSQRNATVTGRLPLALLRKGHIIH